MRKRKQTQFSIPDETNQKIDEIILMEKDLTESKINKSRVVEKAVGMLYDFMTKNKKMG